jgi:hypothetical protein
MKIHFLLTLMLFSLIVVVGCDSTTEPITDGSTLLVSSDTLFLSSTDSVKMLELSLSCGCGFTLEVASREGDSEAILTTPIDSLTTSLSKHSFVFSYSPTITTTPKNMKLNFLAKKSPYSYTNSIVVKVVN